MLDAVQSSDSAGVARRREAGTVCVIMCTLQI